MHSGQENELYLLLLQYCCLFAYRVFNYWNKLLVIILTNKKLLSLDYNTLYSLSYFDAVYSCKFKDTLEKM